MANWNRINLDGLQDIVSAPTLNETRAGLLVNLVNGKFEAAVNGLKRLYAVHTSDINTSVDFPIASGYNVNGDKVVPGRTFALRLAASQTVSIDSELFVNGSGFLTTTGTAGAGLFWANEAMTTGVGVTALISETAK